MSNSKVALIIDVNDGKIASKQSLITRIRILSVPGALPLAIDVTIFLYLFAHHCVEGELL